VIFFTDDKSFAVNDNLEEALCEVVRGPPIRGEVWGDPDVWEIEGDFRIFAVASTIEGSSYSVTAMLCDALKDHYGDQNGGKISPETESAITDLLKNGGF